MWIKAYYKGKGKKSQRDNSMCQIDMRFANKF